MIVKDEKYSTTRMLFYENMKIITNYGHGLRIEGYIKKSTIEKPLITIITVVYNSPVLLEQTILSILNQEYENVEYIVIDGGSNDVSTLEVLKQYNHLIDFWVSEKDNGIYHAMNKGISLSSGDFIAFLNAGDTYCSNNTLSQISSLLSKDFDIIYGDRFYIDGSNNKTFQAARHISTIFNRMPFCHQSTFVRKTIFKKITFNEFYKFAADYLLFIEFYKAGFRFHKIDLPVCNFLHGGASESGIRPFLEVLQILFEKTDNHETAENSSYFKDFISLIKKKYISK